MKSSSVETVHCAEVRPAVPRRVKNFAIWLRYDSQHGTHLVPRIPGPDHCWGGHSVLDMGAQHRVRAHSRNMMKVEEIAEGKC
ncbi:60S ribosomal protein L18a-like protein [Cricetulus griseus]|uniref:60S ribosomal protein L18a-like protein n=1 Tax=Cricetulus griseus TaxID=10029 RepID=A0A061IKX6_CRIGR|nr:60S ribosomal protein L18a-like protein [Cricetulus griseus]